MTEPDEALIWVRENAAAYCDRHGDWLQANAFRQGHNDDLLTEEADAYRAGQAASAERVKALEEVTQNLIAMFDCDDPEVSARAWDEALDEARALLKEADQ